MLKRRAQMTFGQERVREFADMLALAGAAHALWPCVESFAKLTAAEEAAAIGRGHIIDQITLER